MAKLKVFRTPIGFHDAYVAAPSRKAALAAWGADRDLFARGVAEEVTDPALSEAPLAAPGTVIKVSRGSVAEQMAALPDDKPAPKPAPKRAAKARPKPSRDTLDAAEAALAEAEARQEDARAALAREEEALERRKRELKREQTAEKHALQEAVDAADADYRQALEKWRDN